jgi:hypothetical protein
VHVDGAANSFDDADDDGFVTAGRHAVDQANGAALGRELRFEHERVTSIAPSDLPRSGSWGQQPPAMARLAQERSEARVGSEVREAQPVNRSVPAYERRALGIADEPVVFDWERHRFRVS